MGRTSSMYGKRRGAYRVLVGELEERRPPRRPRSRRKANIDGGKGHGLDRSRSEQEQVVGCCEYGDESSGSVQCGVSVLSLLKPVLLTTSSASSLKFHYCLFPLQSSRSCLRLLPHVVDHSIFPWIKCFIRHPTEDVINRITIPYFYCTVFQLQT